MKLSLFSELIYIKIKENRFIIKHIESNKEITLVAIEQFSTQRLLVGNFTNAEKLLKEGIRNLYKSKWFTPSPVAIIHPIEKIEGGLAEIEERAIRELAVSAGAAKVILWVGKELTNEEAKGLL